MTCKTPLPKEDLFEIIHRTWDTHPKKCNRTIVEAKEKLRRQGSFTAPELQIQLDLFHDPYSSPACTCGLWDVWDRVYAHSELSIKGKT